MEGLRERYLELFEDMGFKSPKEVPNERMATSIYKKSIEKLKDADRPKFVRRYFEV